MTRPATRDRFAVGDRVRIDYGPGTVLVVRDGLVGVGADVGQLWFRDPSMVLFADEEGPLLGGHLALRLLLEGVRP